MFKDGIIDVTTENIWTSIWNISWPMWLALPEHAPHIKLDFCYFMLVSEKMLLLPENNNSMIYDLILLNSRLLYF
jgi:hypothetical protein